MASFNVSDIPVRAKPPASSGPGSTSEARTACQQPPDSALPHTCVRTAWQTSLPHGLERCRATPLLDAVGALPARLLPTSHPRHRTRDRERLPPGGSGRALCRLRGRCHSVFSVAPSLWHPGVTSLVIHGSGHLRRGLRDPCPTLQSFIFRHMHCLTFQLAFLLIGEIFSSSLDLSRWEMDHNLHAPQPQLTTATPLPDQGMEAMTTAVLALTSPLGRHCWWPPQPPRRAFTSCWLGQRLMAHTHHLRGLRLPCPWLQSREGAKQILARGYQGRNLPRSLLLFVHMELSGFRKKSG